MIKEFSYVRQQCRLENSTLSLLLSGSVCVSAALQRVTRLLQKFNVPPQLNQITNKTSKFWLRYKLIIQKTVTSKPDETSIRSEYTVSAEN